MSQNFELLTQIEPDLEFGKAATPRAFPNAPRTSHHARHEPFGPELLSLAQTVFLSEDAITPHEVVLCGVDQEGGSSEICRDLGHILASCSVRPICLIDADVHSLRLSNLLDSSRPMAISSSVPEGCVQVAPNLWLATVDSLELGRDGALGPAHRWKQCLAELRVFFGYVLIDAPGVNVRGDAAALGQVADAAILVIEANFTRKAAALRAKRTLVTGKVRLLGSILHNRTFPIPERLYRKL